MSDENLMLAIRAAYGAHIAKAVVGTPYSEAFIAALVANESAGNLLATRIEPKVFTDLSMVLLGKKAAYGSIGGQDLTKWTTGNTLTTLQQIQALLNLATSWGPTQIMGYHCLEFDYHLGELCQAATHFQHTIELLDSFNKRFNIMTTYGQGLSAAAARFLMCWNTGSPNGQTADPQYTANGVARMQIYASLSAPPPHKVA